MFNKTGKAAFICTTPACRYGNEGRHRRQTSRQHVPQNLHTKTRERQVHLCQINDRKKIIYLDIQRHFIELPILADKNKNLNVTKNDIGTKIVFLNRIKSTI